MSKWNECSIYFFLIFVCIVLWKLVKNRRKTLGLQDFRSWLLVSALAAGLSAAAPGAAQGRAASSPAPLPLAVLAGNASRCRVSEFACANNKCIPINRFCDAANDCGDASDEPRHCSRCNRTYYGDIGRTYELELHRPREDRLPYICLLTLTAAGGIHGDLVQVTLDSFTLGRFVSFTVDGCPDGYLQIAESGLPQVGGSWCGTSWGPAIYYSETVSITIVVRLLRLSKDQNNYNFDFRMEYKVLKEDSSSVRYGGLFPVLANKPSHVGRSNAGNASLDEAPATSPPPAQSREYYLGDLIAGTYCSRIFSDCDRKLCRLQSPNFPGVYPRNLTCYYAVRHHEVPAGKHALIRVRQPNGQLVSIRSQSALYAPAAPQRVGGRRALKVWAQCDEVQDYVTIYDGYTTRDPVVLKFCGGGEPVPPAVSSGPEILVEFTTSPFGTFMHPMPLQSLHGFQLEVEVVFVDQQSPTYAKNKRACEFWIRGTGSGVLEHPQHSLPPNTTCLYHMQGIDTSISVSPGPIRSMSYPWRRPGFPYPSPRFRVWFSILKFHVMNSLDPNSLEEEFCASHLNIWDGPMRISPGCSDIFCDAEKWKQVSRATGPQSVLVGRPPSNATLVARYCRERAPRTCEHALLAATRPCARAESFLSRGDSLTLELKVTQSTVIKPVSFKALYEFVDLHQDGQPHGAGPCSRRFRAPPDEDTADVARRFTAPKDVFLYGRGGARNLSCQYRFEAKRGERVKLTISRLWTGGQACATRESAQTARLRCHGRAAATLRVAERPWGDAPRPPLPRDCLCDDKLLPFTYVSSSRLLEVHFAVLGMNATDDFRRFFFEASFEFIRTPVCERPRRMSGPSGEIKFRSPTRMPDEMNCEHHPWLIDPSPGRYLYVQVRGILMIEPNLDYKLTPNNVSIMPEPRYNCLTRNRIAVYAGGLVPVVICPQPPHEMRSQVVEVFSDGWSVGNKLEQHLVLPIPKLDEFNLDKPRTVVVEYIGRETGSYSITWLELMKMKPSRFTAVFAMSEVCKYKCPELDACINASLWCDGVEHCPSGQDESLAHCSAILQLPAQYLALIFALIISIACLTVLAALKVFKRRRTSVLQQRLKSLSSDTGMFDEKEVIC